MLGKVAQTAGTATRLLTALGRLLLPLPALRALLLTLLLALLLLLLLPALRAFLTVLSLFLLLTLALLLLLSLLASLLLLRAQVLGGFFQCACGVFVAGFT